MKRIVRCFLFFGISFGCLAAETMPTISPLPSGVAINWERDHYVATFTNPDRRVDVPLDKAISQPGFNAGSDKVGLYQEITFHYTDEVEREAAIRAYTDKAAVIFRETILADGPNTRSFPVLKIAGARSFLHLSYAGSFSVFQFYYWGNTGPRVLFDETGALIISPASHPMAAYVDWSGTDPNLLTNGIHPDLKDLPKGYVQQTVLVGAPTVGSAFDLWGSVVLDLPHSDLSDETRQGKSRTSNDASPFLKKLCYGTQAGSWIYYNPMLPADQFQPKLLGILDEAHKKGTDFGCVQLDSWYYPKGPNAYWGDNGSGMFDYHADPKLFPQGIKGFWQQTSPFVSKRVPFIRHSRWVWIGPDGQLAQPLRQYKFSGEVIIDPEFYKNTAAEMRDEGTVAHEPDWLGTRAKSAFNLTDPEQYHLTMAHEMAKQGIFQIYCMPLPEDLLQSTWLDNVVAFRPSFDRLQRGGWDQLIYGSHLGWSLGLWPWSDTFMSGETDNMIPSLLSAGLVTVGDPPGQLNAVNLKLAARSDGVLVRPDVPFRPCDQCYVNDGKDGLKTDLRHNMLAPTFTDFGYKVRYLWTYARSKPVPEGTPQPDPRPDDQKYYSTVTDFNLAQVGQQEPVYLYDWFRQTGRVVQPSDQITDAMIDGRAYYVAAPLTSANIAFLGDAGHIATAGRQRIRDVKIGRDGSVQAAVTFAYDEPERTIFGHAASMPSIRIGNGKIVGSRYDSTSQLFWITIAPISPVQDTVDDSLPGTTEVVVSISNYSHYPRLPHR